MRESLYAAMRWVWYGLCITMRLTARERMADMTTVASGAHGHPEVDNMQDLMAQLVDGQTKMMSAITALTENQARMQETMMVMQETISVMQESIATLHESLDVLRASTAALQAATGDLARGLAIVQADVALLVARDDS